MSVERILAIRVGRAGDLVMITPALRAILAEHPAAEVHLLTSPEGRRVLQGFDPRLARVLTYDRHGLGGFLSRRRVRRELARGGYRRIYCFETNPSYRSLLARLPAECRFLEAAAEPAPFPERCLALVTAVPREPSWLWLPVSHPGRVAAALMLSAVGIRASDFVVGLHPSSSATAKGALRGREARRRKTWPLASFARFALLLADHAARAGVKLRLVCDLLPEERALGLELVERSHGVVTLFTEPPDFERYKATIARMNLLITPDTGPMHIAAALGTPLVALFSGRDPADCGPYTDPARYVVLRAEDTEEPGLGLAAVSPDAVFAAAQRFLPLAGSREAVAAATTVG